MNPLSAWTFYGRHKRRAGLLLSLIVLLYVLLMPSVVLAVTAGTTAWTLDRLDPVVMIERR
jgi:hypothetical protein